MRRGRGSSGAGFCQFCDLAATEDVRHFLLHCFKWQDGKNRLLNEIREIADGSGERLLVSNHDKLIIRLGGRVDEFTCNISSSGV